MLARPIAHHDLWALSDSCMLAAVHTVSDP